MYPSLVTLIAQMPPVLEEERYQGEGWSWGMIFLYIAILAAFGVWIHTTTENDKKNRD